MKKKDMQTVLAALQKAKRQVVHCNVAPHGCIDEAIAIMQRELDAPDEYDQGYDDATNEYRRAIEIKCQESAMLEERYMALVRQAANIEALKVPVMYLAAPQERKPLKSSEIDAIYESIPEYAQDGGWMITFARAVEAAHGITGATE